MAEIAISEMPANAEPVITKKTRNSRKALKAKNPSTNEANILAGKVAEATPSPIPTEMPANAEPVITKKTRNSRKALKAKNPSTNEANILAGKVAEAAPSPIPTGTNSDPTKENHESLSQPRTSPKKAKASKKPAKAKASKEETQSSFEKDLQEMEEKLQALRLEKEKTEELLKEKDEILKLKEEELESKGREQDKLHMELKKLQKLKEFKPTMALPIVQSQKDKKGCPEKKRPSPPYVLWCKDQWNAVKQENPEAEFKDISIILGAKWKNVTAEEKKPYEEKYQAEKEAYLQVMAKEKRESEAMHLFEEEHKQKTAMELLEQYMQFKQEAEKDNKKNKKEKDPLKPKQPMSAFFLFTNERRAALNAQNIKSAPEVAKITGEEWKNMTEKQKGPYEKMAKKNKETFMQEMEVYKQQKEEEAAILRKEGEELMKLQKHEAFQMLKKKEKTENIIKKTKEIEKKKKKEEKKLADPNKPKRPASSFILFSKEARKNLLEERPGINNSTITALISVQWKELSEEERKVWNDQAAEAMEAYKKEMDEYTKSVAASIQE